MSVRTVWEDEMEARLEVEAERKVKVERCLFFLWSSLPFSLVAKDDEETIDRLLVGLRGSFSLSSSLEEEELEESRAGGWEPTDVAGGEGNKNDVASEL